jgi:hypothetical protein
MWLLWRLTVLRAFGKSALPLLFTLADVKTFVLILFVFISAAASCMVALDLDSLGVGDSDGGIVWYDTVLQSFNGMLEPFASVQEFEGMLGWKRLTLGFLNVIGTFLIPIALMNVFIATLTNSYSRALYGAEQLFWHRVAICSLRAMYQKDAWECLVRCGGLRVHDDEKRLWYTVEHIDKDEEQVGTKHMQYLADGVSNYERRTKRAGKHTFNSAHHDHDHNSAQSTTVAV